MENTCGFVHLHNHTMYSLLDGAIRPKDLIKTAADMGMGAVAMTDHGAMFNAVEFYLTANNAGIKPIIGSEVYVAIEGMDVKRAARGNNDGANHLVLLAETNQGYLNLMKIVSEAYTRGFYYKPRTDKDFLREHSEGIIAMSACIGGEVPQLILQGHTEEAEKAALELRDIFGEGNFFLEIQDHGIPEEKTAIAGLVALSKKTGIPLVATNDAHYLNCEDSDSHEVLLCISTGKTLNDEKRMKMSTDQLYFKSPDEMKALFADYPEAIENTVRIAERCNVEIKIGDFNTVQFELPDDFEGTADDYLAKVSAEGLIDRYGEEATVEYTERLEYELGVIREMGFSDYFLAIYDCTRAAREMDIPVGTARGSAGGSLVAYAIGITNLDPMRFDLIFERFLNPERVSMPDFDVDYADRDRSRMIDYVKEKYGADHVCQIITFGTMKARLVVRDVGRVMDLPYAEVDAIAKLVPSDLGMTLTKALELVPELRTLRDSDETHTKFFKHALTLEGLARHAGTHAAGVVITPGPSTEYLPLYKPQNEDVTSQYTMEFVEKIGCLKVDFLGLRTLTVIKDAVDMINAGRTGTDGKAIDIDAIPLDDPAIYELMGNAATIGVFQFESGGMRDYLKKLQPTCIEDLIAMNALYRPGPLGANMVDDFIDRKHGRSEITYPHPLLEEILHETYGVIVYQEQVMKIANVMAGFTLGGADELRRAMGKKKALVMAEMKNQFLEGARKKDIDTRIAGDVFDLMAHFAGYGFNKSHSAGYAILAYQTAWLKAHYPAEFMAANLTSEMDNTERIVILIEECRRMGIEVLPPDVNSSDAVFTVESGNVRFGMGGVKNVGRAAIDAVVAARKDEGPFSDLFNFCTRIDLSCLNKRMMESLALSGSMDALGSNRAQLSEGIEGAVEYAQAVYNEKISGQTNLFGGINNDEGSGDSLLQPPALPLHFEAWTRMERLANEKSVLGFWFSGHPLEGYADELRAFTTPFSDLILKPDRASVTVGGVITTVSRKTRKSDNAPFIVLRIEDLQGSGEVLLMNGAYDEFKDTVAIDQLVLVEGTVASRQGEQSSVFANSFTNLEDSRERTRSVYVVIDAHTVDSKLLDNVTSACTHHPGSIPIWLKLTTATNGTYRVKTNRFAVAPTPALVKELRGIVGEESVWIG
jgi:DNA polymerase III subunit alpha